MIFGIMILRKNNMFVRLSDFFNFAIHNVDILVLTEKFKLLLFYGQT